MPPAADDGFAPEQIAAAEAHVAHLTERIGAPLAAYLGGSRAFGLGNRLSDVDLTVVVPDGPITGLRTAMAPFVGAVQMHADLVRLGELAAVVERFTAASLPADDLVEGAVAVLREQRDVLELLDGRYLSTSPEVEALRGALDRGRVGRLCAAASAVEGTMAVRDAAGALDSGDLLTAAAAAEIAFETAVEVALALAGELYRSGKFQHRRLARSPLAALLPVARTVPAAGCDPADEVALARAVRARLLTANAVQGAALLDVPAAWPTDPVAAAAAGGRRDGPLRRPDLTLVPVGEAWRLSGGDGAYELGRDAAVLWLLADGRPADALRAAFAAHYGEREADVARFVERNLASLERLGALA